MRQEERQPGEDFRKWIAELFSILYVPSCDSHKCLICMGSNYNREMNMLLARRKLIESFPSICFMPERLTEPLYFHNPSLFSNQLAVFRSEEKLEKVQNILKEIEWKVGRRPEDKKEEKVCLDIDLLLYDNQILKPEDWKREYVLQSLSAFHSSLAVK